MSDERTPLALVGYKLVHRFEDAVGCSVPTAAEARAAVGLGPLNLNNCVNIWDFGGGGNWEVWIVARPERPAIVEGPAT